MAEPRQRARAARAGQAERALAELRQLEVGARPPLWLYTRAFEALRGQPAKFASARHGVRLARVLDRYERYRDCRPQGWPAAAAAALVRTIEQGAHTIRGEPIESLAGYLHQLDRLTRHMRRAYKREHAERYHEAARRRARRRRRRRAASTFRRPLPPIELATLHDAYLAAGHDDIRVLELLGRLATREQLRRELRERYLISRRTTGGYGGFSRGDTSAAGRGRREQAPPALANRQVQPSNEAGQTAARRRGPNRGEVVLRAGAARPGTARVGPVPGEDRHARPRPRSRAR